MRRREFITIVGGAAATWPLAARAQQPAMPVIGFLGAGAREPLRQQIAAFLEGLKESGYVESQNVAIKHRYAINQVDRLPALMAELVGRQVTVLAATGGTARTAKAATATLPIAFTTGDDPVKAGLVADLNRPGGNLIGVSLFSNRLGSKRFGVLHEMVPTASPLVRRTTSKRTACFGRPRVRCQKHRPFRIISGAKGGKTWILTRTYVPDGSAARWHPITVDATEAVIQP